MSVKFNNISNDIWYEIINGLNMYDLVKLSLVNPYYYEQCDNNNIWENHYNSLFDRRIITQDAIHNGPITWWSCRCVQYPGWMNIHREIKSDDILCKKIEHYTNIKTKILKRKFKSYKKQTKKRFLHLLQSDTLVTHNYMVVHEYRKTKMEIENLTNRLNSLECNLNSFKKAKSIINAQ